MLWLGGVALAVFLVFITRPAAIPAATDEALRAELDVTRQRLHAAERRCVELEREADDLRLAVREAYDRGRKSR